MTETQTVTVTMTAVEVDTAALLGKCSKRSLERLAQAMETGDAAKTKAVVYDLLVEAAEIERKFLNDLAGSLKALTDKELGPVAGMSPAYALKTLATYAGAPDQVLALHVLLLLHERNCLRDELKALREKRPDPQKVKVVEALQQAGDLDGAIHAAVVAHKDRVRTAQDDVAALARVLAHARRHHPGSFYGVEEMAALAAITGLTSLERQHPHTLASTIVGLAIRQAQQWTWPKAGANHHYLLKGQPVFMTAEEAGCPVCKEANA